MNKILRGKMGEDLAARHLQSKNYSVLERNWTCHWGEIDLVTWSRGVLIFVEVKYRANPNYGKTYEYIDKRKRQKLLRTINKYLQHVVNPNIVWRLDAVCLTKVPGKVQIDHFENILQD